MTLPALILFMYTFFGVGVVPLTYRRRSNMHTGGWKGVATRRDNESAAKLHGLHLQWRHWRGVLSTPELPDP